MRIAIPLAEGRLCLHFGHCQQFALIDADEDSNTILAQAFAEPPAHEPGALPKWLGEQNVDVVIAGGMGMRARQLLAEAGIRVLVGAAQAGPEEVVSAYLEGRLEMGENICDH